jgi:phage recombination protein Bet
MDNKVKYEGGTIAKRDGLLTSLATSAGMDRQAYWKTLKATVLPPKVTDEQVMVFLSVAKEYGLNPMTNEIKAFPSRGGIIPMVVVDGWIKLANRHPEMDGVQTEDVFDGEGKLTACTTTVWRKDRSHPIVITEYLNECKRNTEPWAIYPHRMLRHKSMIQAFRVAFGFAGIFEPDEVERIHESSNADYKDAAVVEGAVAKSLENIEALKSRVIQKTKDEKTQLDLEAAVPVMSGSVKEVESGAAETAEDDIDKLIDG